MAYGSADSGYDAGASVFHPDASHADTVFIANADLLFNGAFKRHGPDLILTGHDGDRHVVPGYFSSEQHPALVAPNGARLSAALVDLLAGSPAPGQYAQAASTTPASPIGKVEKIVGHVVVFRNGVEVALNVGDAVYKGDVIQTGVNSACGVDFPDGTALNLVANTRMALSEFSFDPNGHSNDALFSLVQGTFAFVAGKVAHTGDMKIETPVATMGIRGTTGFVQEQVATISANAGNVTYSFAVVEDYATSRVGSYELVDSNPSSPTYGQVIATVSQNGFLTFITPQGANLPPIVTTQPMSNSQLGFEQQIIDDLFVILNSGTAPQSTPRPPGSSTPPSDMPRFLQLLQNDFGNAYTFNVANGGYGQTAVTATINGGNGGNPNNPGTPPNNPRPQNTSNIFIWSATNGPGTWITPTWSQPGIPNTAADAVEVLSGPLTYNNTYTIGSLYVAPGVIFDITGGSLTVLGLTDDEGTILVTGDPPALKIEGPLTVGVAGHLRASGAGDIIDIDNSADNLGVIAATDRGKIVFNQSDLTNDKTLKADDHGTIKIKHSAVENTGKIEAENNGTISFDHSTVRNDDSAKIVASTAGSIDFDKDSRVVNSHKSLIEAKDGGAIWFDGGTIVNKHHSTIEAIDCGIVVFCGVSDLINKSGSKIVAEDHGTVKFDATSVTNDGGTIAAIGCDAKVELADSFIGGGTLKTDNGGVIETVYGCSTLDGVTIGCDSYLLVKTCTTLTLSGGTTMDDGTLCIGCHGTVDIETCRGATLDGVTVWNRGDIEVGDSGRATLTLAGDTSISGDGTFSVGGSSTVIADEDTAVGITASSIDNCGTIEASNSATLTLTTSDSLSNHGTIEATGNGSRVDLLAGANGNTIQNSGTIEAVAHGTVNFQHPAGQPTLTIDNNGGTIEAIGNGATVALHHVTVDNTDGGTDDGVIKATGTSSVELFNGTDIIGGTISADGNGVVEITAGHTGAKVTFDGSTMALTINGAGDVQVDDNTSLTLQGTIDNHGTIDLGVTSGAILTIDGTVNLDDQGGAVNMVAGDTIIGSCGGGTLNNHNTIAGAGTISDGTTDLALDNENNGTINATGTLTIDTGDNAITNAGTLEATGPTGDLIVASAVTGTGSATIGNGAVIEFESTVSLHQTVTFSSGGYGKLIIDDAAGFSGHIAGFTGTNADTPSLTTTDEIDVTDINYEDGFSEHYNSMTGVLKISDGTTTAKLTFTDFSGTFQFTSDGSGGTLIFDPPATNSSSPSASFGKDSFVFHTGTNGGNTGTSWDAGTRDHADWAHTHQEWSQLAGDMNGVVAAEIAQHAESHLHYALHGAEHLH